MSVKQIQRTELIGLSKGLMTDANPLASSIEYTRDEVNFEFHPDGSRSRRLGLDREMFGIDIETTFNWTQLKLSKMTTYFWDVVGGDPNVSFIVIQIGNKLHFFEPNGGSRSETILKGTVTLPLSDGVSLRYGALDGYLGIVNGTPNIGLVTYHPDDSTFTYSTFRIEIRDQFGVQETTEPKFETNKNFRGPLTRQHYYNLYNQGWAIPRKDWTYAGPLMDAVNLGSNKAPTTQSPSNSDTVWLGLGYKPSAETSPESFEAFQYKQFEGVLGSDAIAAKGFFIIDAFTRGTSRLEKWNQHVVDFPITGQLLTGYVPPTDQTSGGPTSVCAHSGRFFYSGCRGSVTDGDARSPNWNNVVFFTQLIKNRSDFGKCYQEGDPTSRESSDVVDTDGGFFFVSEAKNIHTMYSMGDRLFLIAENGVWTVTGGSNYGFTATNYKIDKISTFGGVANQSFVEFGGIGYFWGWGGIYAVAKNQFGDWEVQNISKDIIDGFYSMVSSSAKESCQGLVDRARRQIRWVYTEGVLFDGAISKELILDIKYKAFYPFKIESHPEGSAYILSGTQFGDFTTTFTEGVVVNGTDTVVHDTYLVRSAYSQIVPMDSNVKYLTVRSNELGNLVLAFCEYRNTSFEDWAFTGHPVDAKAYLETNAFTGGDFTVNKQSPYLTMAFKNTEKLFLQGSEAIDTESSCIGRFQWNFSNLQRSGKWSRDQQLYRKSKFYYNEDADIDTGFDLVITKTKLRGIGKSLVLHIETEPGKDCHVYGWNFSLTANST